MATTDSNTNYDAEQMKADIASGEEKEPKVDADADYERSKQFDVAETDKKSKNAPSSTGSETASK